MAWTNPRTWVALETVTATLMNTHVRDNFKAVGDAWTTYTPSWTASTNPTIGNGVIDAAYRQTGKAVDFRILITAGSTTTFGNGQMRLSLPSTPVTGITYQRFRGTAFDASTPAYYPIEGMWLPSFTALVLWCDPTTAGATSRAVNSAAPFTFTTADAIAISGTYEAS